MNRTTFFLMFLIIIILAFVSSASVAYLYKMDGKPNTAAPKAADSLHVYFNEKMESGRQKMYVVNDSSLTTKYECYLELIKDSIFKNNTYVLGDTGLKIKTYDRFVAVYKRDEMVKLIHFSIDSPSVLRFKALY